MARLDFRLRNTPGPGSGSGRPEARLFTMVSMLGICLLMMQALQHPDAFFGFLGVSNAGDINASPNANVNANAENAAQNAHASHAAARPRYSPGLVVARRDGLDKPEAPPVDEGKNADANPKALSNDPAPPKTGAESIQSLKADRDKDKSETNAGAKIPDEEIQFQLENLRDSTRDLPIALYYHFLEKARYIGTADMLRHGRKDITFAHLLKDKGHDAPKYRGQLITIRGRVVRAVENTLKANAYGLKRAYELWIITPDSGKFPWVVLTSELPAGFPMGGEIMETAAVGGYFLKLWKYEAADGYRIAPVLFADNIVWTPAPALNNDRTIRPFLIGFVVIIGIIVVPLGIYVKRQDILSRRSRVGELSQRLGDLPDTIRLPGSPDQNPLTNANAYSDSYAGIDDEHHGGVGLALDLDEVDDDEDDDDARAPWRASLRPDAEWEALHDNPKNPATDSSGTPEK